MDVTCNVIEDLLPLYADGICSEDSKTIVEHHVAVCSECKEKLEAMTAKLETEGSGKIPYKPKNPFKKLRFRYIRTIIITLCICVIIAVPSVICTILSINEVYGGSASWSTLKAERKMKNLGNTLKNGRYAEAVDEILNDSEQYGYPDENFLEIKEILADDLKNYFEKHHIKNVNVFARKKATGEIDTHLYLELEHEFVNSRYFAVVDILFVDDVYTRSSISLEANYDSEQGIYLGTAEEESSYEMVMYYYQDLPDLNIISADHTKEYFDRIISTDYDENYAYWVLSMEFSENLWGKDGWEKTLKERYDAMQSFAEAYEYVNCRTGYTQYIPYEYGDYTSRCYLQHASLKFLCGSETVTVECDVPFKYDYLRRFSAVRNIVYSDNAPEDFRTQFESIFAQ